MSICFWERQGQKQDKSLNSQLFLVYLIPLAWAGCPCFCLVAASLMVGLAIGEAVSIRDDVTISFLEWSW